MADAVIQFSDGTYGCRYADAELDTYLNTTWYNTLTATAKAAIVDKNITQDIWYWSGSGEPDYNGTYYDTKTYKTYNYIISPIADSSKTSGRSEAPIGTRHIYALSAQDVLDYLETTPSMTTANTTLTGPNVRTMFWNPTDPSVSISEYPWLRSAYADRSYIAWHVRGRYGNLNIFQGYYGDAARPALTIDLSKISWS